MEINETKTRFFDNCKVSNKTAKEQKIEDANQTYIGTQKT